MLRAKGIIYDVYQTYSGDSEWHKFRTFSTFVVGFVIAIFGNDLDKAVFPAIALTISVLAGFSFTALFSGNLLNYTDLPPAKDESDRSDIRKLKLFAHNFRIRSKYFLILSIITLVMVVLTTVELRVNWEQASSLLAGNLIREQVFEVIRFAAVVKEVILFIAILAIIVAFFECLYTFYRLSETAMAVIDTRRSYLDNHE